jgi:predicted ATPase/DNA-binding SARP family transcriptional activator
MVTTADGGPVAVTAPRHQTLLAGLLVARAHPVSAQRLVNEVWPDGAPATALAALQVYVSDLRKLFGDRLRRQSTGYLLEVAAADVDAFRFEQMLTGDPVGALQLWRGPAFDGVTVGPDASAAAHRWNELRLSTRERLARQALGEGRHAEMLADLSAWVAEQPTNEPLVRHLMLALYRSGRAADSIRAYEHAADLLRTQLGAAPGEELAALVAAIRRQDPTLAAARPGLPASRTRFIGRRIELDQAASLLGQARLLTVVGPGGCGKTRLAYQLAHEVADDHPGGTHAVELAGFQPRVSVSTVSTVSSSAVSGSTSSGSTVDASTVDTVDALTARLAAAVGAREVPGLAIATSLARHLGQDRALLVLDNCEHVRDAVAAIVHNLLSDCSGVRVLATSREPLGLPAEFVFRLGGLALPAADDMDSADAVRLFADRVAAARGGQRWRPGEESAVVELCHRLDGLPLALELAAARLRTLSLREVAARLDGRLDLLVSSSPVARHQTMRAAIGWGHDLLEPAQQVLLRRLSVFAGGFDLAAAERVGADASGPAPREAGEVLDLLSALVEQSMVDRFDGPEHSSRYRLIETTREYAAERLSDASDREARAATRRHGEVYAELLAPPPPTDGPAHAGWLARIGTDHDNICLALERALTDDDAELGLAIATPMWWYWWVTGRMLEGRIWLARALKSTAGGVSPRRGRALRAAAALARNSGDLAAARQLGEEALSTFDRLDDRAGVISALNNLSITAQGQEDYDASLAFGYRGLELAESTEDDRPVAAALNNIAGTLRCLDRLDEAADLFGQALARFQTLSDRRGEAAALFNLATVDRRQGRLDRSRRRYQEALDRYVELEIEEGQLDAAEGLAHLAALAGGHRDALLALLVCGRRRSQLGAPLFTPDERVDRATAEERARTGLTSDEIDAVARAAESTPLAEVLRTLGQPSGQAGNHDRP